MSCPCIRRRSGKRELVRRPRRRVVDRHLRRVPHDLRVTCIRLELDATPSVIRQPESSGAPADERGGDVPEQRARRKQVVREGDPRIDALRRTRTERVVQRLRYRLARGRGTGAVGHRHCDQRCAHGRCGERGEQQEEPPGGKRRNTDTIDPFGWAARLLLCQGSELRAGRPLPASRLPQLTDNAGVQSNGGKRCRRFQPAYAGAAARSAR